MVATQRGPSSWFRYRLRARGAAFAQLRRKDSDSLGEIRGSAVKLIEGILKASHRTFSISLDGVGSRGRGAAGKIEVLAEWNLELSCRGSRWCDYAAAGRIGAIILIKLLYSHANIAQPRSRFRNAAASDIVPVVGYGDGRNNSDDYDCDHQFD